ncbi:MAG: hypothetical protein LBG92_10300 [Prevotellaceae bacterium]|jgi:hypothetical protein|nr:hypothetical protein [Prevotellaceae bacterium]
MKYRLIAKANPLNREAPKKWYASPKLGEFGTVRLILQSGGVDTSDEFNSSKIKGVKIVFTPGSELKSQLHNSVVNTILLNRY